MSLLFRHRPTSGATQRKLSFFQRFIGFFVSNFRQALNSLGEIWRDPTPSILTIAVLGVSLTLPATLYVAVKNADSVQSNWNNAAEISLFMKENLTLDQIKRIKTQVQLNPKVAQVELISKAQALAEFERLSGFGDALNHLPNNPLPDVLLVTPQVQYSSAANATELLNELLRLVEVESGKLDIEWLERLNALLTVAQKLMFGLTLLLALSVVLIVGNTIRLLIINRKDEIEVLKMVGATNSFIQRPFLYTGLWFGFFGGLLAWFTIEIMISYLTSAILHITELYQSDFSLQGLSVSEMLILLLVSILLGLSGSYIVVKRQIKHIEPDML